MKKTIITNLLVLIFILALGACSNDAGNISGTTTETLCTDGLDDDGDDLIDCDDSDCDADTTNCPSGDLGEDNDDDGDTYTENAGDCDDSNGTINPGATETADDGIDQDCDGSDLSSGTDPVDADSDTYYAGTETGEDCNDSDSAINPAASEVLESGLVDENCDDFILQATETDCTDGVDNDGDTFIDCAADANCNDDSQADATTACGTVADVTETACTDGADNDGDTYADCSDSDCDVDTTNCPAAVTELDPPTNSATDAPPYNPLNGSVGMVWVDPVNGSNYQSDGVTLNDCTTVTAPCADFKAALANLPIHGIVGVFEGTGSYTGNVTITKPVKIDGGFFWETLPDPATGGGVLGFDPMNHHSVLEFSGASFVVNAPGKAVAINGLGIIGDHFPSVLHIMNSSPTFRFCRIYANGGVAKAQAVNISNIGTGLAAPTFLNSQIIVGNVTAAPAAVDSISSAIGAVNSSTGRLELVLRNNRIAVGAVAAYTGNISYSTGIRIQGNVGGRTNLTLWQNDIGLGLSQKSSGVVGGNISRGTIADNSIFVKGGAKSSIGIMMSSTGVGIEALEITGNLISLHKNAPTPQNTNTGIDVTGFATTISSNTLVQGLATDSIGVSVDNSTNSQALSMTNNFLQSHGVTSSTMISLSLGGATTTTMPLDISYNGFHFAATTATPYVFSDSTNMFATVVTGTSTGMEDSASGLATLTGTYTGTLAVTSNLDVASTDTPLAWIGPRVTLAASSALVDKGDPSLTTGLDINGKPRVVDGDNADGDSDATTGAIIDMGAAEAQ